MVTAPIPEKLRAMLGFLEKMTLNPGELKPADVEPLRSAGISGEEMADAMGWEMQTDVAIHRHAEMLLKMGYE